MSVLSDGPEASQLGGSQSPLLTFPQRQRIKENKGIIYCFHETWLPVHLSFACLIHCNSDVPFRRFYFSYSSCSWNLSPTQNLDSSARNHEEGSGEEQVSLELIFLTMAIRKAGNLVTWCDRPEKKRPVHRTSPDLSKEMHGSLCPFLLYCGVCGWLFLTMSPHKTFRIK